MRFKDTHSYDMFEMLPPPAVSCAGSLACRAEIASTMSDALKPFDRYDIAASMSKLLGRDISKFMLDAYTAESREDHIPPLDTAIAFDIATGTNSLINLAASKVGARVLVGKDALNAELGRLQRVSDEALKKAKSLKKALGESHD